MRICHCGCRKRRKEIRVDYRDYGALMERYHTVNEVAAEPDETRESLIKKLVDVSHQKKQILSEANGIIGEYIVKYEKDPALLNGEAVEALGEFIRMVTTAHGDGMLDPALGIRIGKLLLAYYRAAGDMEMTVNYLFRCSFFDMLLRSQIGGTDFAPYSAEAEKLLPHYDSLSEVGKLKLVHSWLMGVYNTNAPMSGLDKFRQMREQFEELDQKAAENPGIQEALAMFVLNSLQNALDGFASVPGNARERQAQLEKETPVMELFQQGLQRILDSENPKAYINDRVLARLLILRTDYRLGKISVEEFFEKLRDFALLPEDYDAHERGSAVFSVGVAYIKTLCTCGEFERQYVTDKCMETIGLILKNIDDSTKALSEYSQYLGEREMNSYMLTLISAASGHVDFDFFKTTVLNTTVYADKALYVHTMMVKEIALVLLDYILEHDPAYLDGVAGRGWEYARDHKREMRELMENCALLHDIGKYFCLDIVNNASRGITDDEFEIVKHHPTNFSRVYTGDMSPEIQCICDCARLHHLWYNEAGGYPNEAHTCNKPFVNILTIADCIDAATDTIGRPYGSGKTFEQVRAEFDRDRGTRYSGYISDLLHIEEILRQIEYIVNERRKDIYCDIYLGAGDSQTASI